jgi:hypothetical protein
VLSGTNWRGEKITPKTAFEDYLVAIAPISLRWLPGVSHLIKDISPTERYQDVSMFEQAAQSQGFQISRKSDINEAYGIAMDWRRSQPPGQKQQMAEGVGEGVYPVSPYQPIRYALEDRNDEKVLDEIAKWEPKTRSDLEKLSSEAHQSMLHPWTGSVKTDEKMMEELPERDQHKVLLAQFGREAMAGRLDQLLERYGKEHGIEGFTARGERRRPFWQKEERKLPDEEKRRRGTFE